MSVAIPYEPASSNTHDDLIFYLPVPISLGVVLVALGFASRRAGSAFRSLFTMIRDIITAVFTFAGMTIGFTRRR